MATQTFWNFFLILVNIFELNRDSEDADGTDFRVHSHIQLYKVPWTMDIKEFDTKPTDSMQNMRNASLSHWRKCMLIFSRSSIQINLTFADKVNTTDEEFFKVQNMIRSEYARVAF